ncbi:Retrovirus-related Pol polyprotein from transposon TNT 1-94 [Linum grandiflorum]
MKNAKSISTPLATHFKLSKKACPATEKEKEAMSSIIYSSAVGSLMYTMVCTRPDIAHAVGLVSRFLSNPGKAHWEAVKWIFKYLRGGAISWQSKLQQCVALSTTEAEYIAAVEARNEMLWLKRFLQELSLKQKAKSSQQVGRLPWREKPKPNPCRRRGGRGQH